MMQEKRGMMKVWNVWLIFITFMLSILGTLLTRKRHRQLRALIRAIQYRRLVYRIPGNHLRGLSGLLYQDRDHLRSENKLESLVSRESSFMFNNLLLLGACFAVLCGTLFPILSELVRDVKMNLGAPFYNKVMVPIGLFLIFLTGVGPLLAWRNTSVGSIKRNFAIPGTAALLIEIAVGILLFKNGVRFWTDMARCTR